MEKKSLSHLKHKNTVKQLERITMTITWLSQILIYTNVSRDNYFMTKVNERFLNMIQLTDLVTFLLKFAVSNFDRLSPYFLYKFLMLCWHDVLDVSYFAVCCVNFTHYFCVEKCVNNQRQ